jgi:hypothetical protein
MAAVWPGFASQLCMNVHDGYLYIGTDGNGTWRTSLAGILPVQSVQFSQPAWLSGPFHKCVNVFLDPVSGWLG